MAESGDALWQKGESLLSGKKAFFGLGGAKYEEAAEKFKEAGDAYRGERNMQRAGQAFRRAADIYRKHLEGGAIDAATQEHEAFKCFRKDSPQEAADALNSAIKFYSRQNPRRAATHLETLAKFYEEDVKDQRKAMEAYGEAAEKFEYDNAGSLANKNKIKHAEYLALLDANYFQASKEFEDVAEAYNNLGTMKYSVPEVLLKAGICQLATGDMVGARKKFEEKYPEISSANPFPQARESKFLNDLVQAVENGDPEAFSMSCFQWDQMSKLDTWKTAILARVKEQIESAGEDFS